MSDFTFLVTVSTDRESGLIVSRDEQSEKIIGAIEEAAESADLSGLGARSDSVYTVTEVSAEEIVKRDEKALHAEYEQHVREQEPSDDELRRDLADAKHDAQHWQSMFERQKAIVDQLMATPENQPTRIAQRDRVGSDAVATYLKDGPYDSIEFTVGDDAMEKVDIRFDRRGDLEVRYNGMTGEFAVLPHSGNQLSIRILPRKGL